jgi:hypothetical protein
MIFLKYKEKWYINILSAYLLESHIYVAGRFLFLLTNFRVEVLRYKFIILLFSLENSTAFYLIFISPPLILINHTEHYLIGEEQRLPVNQMIGMKAL